MTFLARGRRGGGGHGMGSGEVIMYERVTTGWNGRVGRGKGKGKGREERRVGRRERSCSLQTFIRYFFWSKSDFVPPCSTCGYSLAG